MTTLPRWLKWGCVSAVCMDAVVPVLVHVPVASITAGFAITSAASLFFLSMWFVSRRPRLPSRPTLLVRVLDFAIWACILQGAVVAVLRGNGMLDSLTDTYRLLLTSFAINLYARSSPDDRAALVRTIATVLIAAELAKLATFVALLSLGVSYPRLGGGGAVVSGLVIAGLLANKQISFKYSLLSAGVLVQIFLPLVRSLWFTAVAQTIIALAAAAFGVRPNLAALLKTGALVAIAFYTMTSITGVDLTTVGTTRIQSTFDAGDDSFTLRTSERTGAQQTLEGLDNPWAGAGLGATFRRDAREIHHIHDTFASITFRHGVFGYLLLFGLVAIAARACLLALLGSPYLGWHLGALGSVVVSLSFYGLIGVFAASLALSVSATDRIALVRSSQLNRLSQGVRSRS